MSTANREDRGARSPDRRVSAWCVILAFGAVGLGTACDNDTAGPVLTVPSVVGTVVSSTTGHPVRGATVSIGASAATTDSDGRFELTDLTVGPATLRCIAAGFEDFEAGVTLRSGSATRDIALTPVAHSSPLLIRAEIGARNQTVFISRDGEDVRNAVVTVNGSPVPRSIQGPFYERRNRLTPGEWILEVIDHADVVRGIIEVPETPVLTAPPAGARFHVTDSITVTWSSATDPDGFWVSFGLGSGFTTDFPTAGNVRELRVAADRIGLMNDLVGVSAFNVGSFTGRVTTDSSLHSTSLGSLTAMIAIEGS